jgi:HEAT repeat protein
MSPKRWVPLMLVAMLLTPSLAWSPLQMVTKNLQSPDAEVRLQAVQQATQLGGPRVAELLAAAYDREPHYHPRPAPPPDSCTHWGDEGYYDSPVRAFRRTVIGAFSTMGPESIMAGLEAEPSMELARDLIKLLGESRDWRAQRFLLGHVPEWSKAQEPLLTSAFAALALVGDTRAVPCLVEALEDPSPSISSAAACALTELYDPATITPVARIANTAPDFRLCRTSVYVLGELGALVVLQSPEVQAEVEAALSRVSRDPNSLGRVVAAVALGKINSPVCLRLALRALEDPKPDVRLQAAKSLGQIGGDSAKVALTRALNDPHPAVRNNAGYALEALERKATPISRPATHR